MPTVSCWGCKVEIAADQRLCLTCDPDRTMAPFHSAIMAVRAFARFTRTYDAIIDTPGWSVDDIAYQDAVNRMEWAEQWVLDIGDRLLDEDAIINGDGQPPERLGVLHAKRPR